MKNYKGISIHNHQGNKFVTYFSWNLQHLPIYYSNKRLKKDWTLTNWDGKLTSGAAGCCGIGIVGRLLSFSPFFTCWICCSKATYIQRESPSLHSHEWEITAVVYCTNELKNGPLQSRNSMFTDHVLCRYLSNVVSRSCPVCDGSYDLRRCL